MPTDTKFSLLRVLWTSSRRASPARRSSLEGRAVTQGATGLPLSSPREADLKNQTNPVLKPFARASRPAAAGGAAGLGHVITASGRPRLLFIALHGKATESDNRDCCGARRRLDLLHRIKAASSTGSWTSISTRSGRSVATLATLSAPSTASITVYPEAEVKS